jgi:glycerophosphoryl diester phosphodiesterase
MIYRSHRGGVYYTPENTMPAFRAALTEGFAYIETDPCFTKDGVIILHHDATINRTLRNSDGTPIEVPIKHEDLTYAELCEYDAGIALGEKFRGTRVPKLSELLSLCEGTGVIVALDKKIQNDQLDILIDEVLKYNTRVCFSCADTARMKKIQSRIPDAMIDYDGVNTDAALSEVCALVKRENLLVWVYLDKPNFAWLTDRDKASAEVCARVKKYARLGIGNVNNAYDVKEALEFAPDVLEV